MPFTSRDYIDSLDPHAQQYLLTTEIPLGYHPDTKDALFIPDRDRFAGTYILGVQGVGKSGFLHHLIQWDASVGNAVIVIDPHGDLTDDCVATLPGNRVAQTYVLDMEDEDFPFGMNLFAVGKGKTDVAKAQAVDRILHVFEVLWPEVMTQQHLPRYLRALTITLLDNPGSTLVDMYAFLRNPVVRQRMIPNVTEPTVRDFWQSEYEGLSHAEIARRIQPLLNRLESLFMGRSLIRNIVGQPRTSINFRKAIEAREIVFIKLPVKTVAQDARLIGTIIMAQIYAAIFSFADIPEDRRPGLSLYVDEFQHFSTSDFSSLFTEGRKFGIKTTVAHQYRGQLPDFLRQSTMTARTKVVFQTTIDDAREMAHLFPIQNTTVDPETIDTDAVKYLITRGSPDPYVEVFIDTYLRPLQSYKRGNKVDIQDRQWQLDWKEVMMKGAINTDFRKDLYVPDPTPYLNHLLYDVMVTGDARKAIPFDAMIGFSNCGRGFFTYGRNARDELYMNIIYPQHLVVDTPVGPRWSRAPESAREQFYHFIFYLRQTLEYLARNPIGKVSATTPAEVSRMLTQLPRRSAFVKSGEDIGVIYTFPTPPEVQGIDLSNRRLAIIHQTRQRYCNPKDALNQWFAAGGTQRPRSVPQGAASVPGGTVGGQLPPVRWEEDEE